MLSAMRFKGSSIKSCFDIRDNAGFEQPLYHHLLKVHFRYFNSATSFICLQTKKVQFCLPVNSLAYILWPRNVFKCQENNKSCGTMYIAFWKFVHYFILFIFFAILEFYTAIMKICWTFKKENW